MPAFYRHLGLLGLYAITAAGALGSRAAADWPTHRGNPQRTASTDGRPGPSRPRVLWVYRSQDHFLAAPVLAGDRLLLCGLGGFNVPTLLCLRTDPQAQQRLDWSRTTPVLRRPIVSAPAVHGDVVVFGDGMHQTDGGTLHGLRLRAGTTLWQLPLEGKLIHLEGAPTIADGRVYMGCGNDGVVCVALDRVDLEGQRLGLQEAARLLEAKWQQLQAAYESERKKDPEFAVPPTEDQLPKAVPVRYWQQGRGRWHVDAPVAVVGDRVLVASAFLEQERQGERALYCLNTADGTVCWRAELVRNPWAGPAVDGSTVVVAGSSMGYDPRQAGAARGELAAFSLSDGKRLWHRDLPGGILGSVALANGLAVAGLTDGTVRAFDLVRGTERWSFKAQAAIFAAPAVAGGVVYAGDLQGRLYALTLDQGAKLWQVDLGKLRGVEAPGMIYGGPVIQAGRLYVATCNLAEGPFSGQPTVIVCLGDD